MPSALPIRSAVPVDAAIAIAPSAASASAQATGAAGEMSSVPPLEAPFLGAARAFAVLGAAGVRNVGATTLVGALGADRADAIEGVTAEVVRHAGDDLARAAVRDVEAAAEHMAQQNCTTQWRRSDLTGLTLTPGVHCFASSVSWSGPLKFDAQGRDSAVFVLRISGTLTTQQAASVAMLDCAHEGRVFWQVGGAATLGAATQFAGNLLALESIALGPGTRSWGRFLSRRGKVSMDSSQVSIRRCEDAIWPDDLTEDAGVDDAGR